MAYGQGLLPAMNTYLTARCRLCRDETPLWASLEASLNMGSDINSDRRDKARQRGPHAGGASRSRGGGRMDVSVVLSRLGRILSLIATSLAIARNALALVETIKRTWTELGSKKNRD